MSEPLRGLVIGAGYFSRFHLEAWQRMPDVRTVGICDLDEGRAREAAEAYGIDAVFTAADRAIDAFRPDFVDIVTRPDTHLPLVELAADRGVAIVCQKPLADDIATARRIVETAERAGVRFMVHENFRFQPWYREIKRLLEAGMIGETLHGITIRTRTGDGAGPEAYLERQPYFREMPRLLMHETGVHFVDTLRFLAGEVVGVDAVLRRLNPVIAGEDAGLVTLRFASGAVGVWDANRWNESTADDPRYTFGTVTIEADGGSLRLDEEGRLFVKPLGEDEFEHAYHHERRGFAGDCVYFTQRHFVERLRDGRPFETCGEEYLRTLEVVEAAYEASATRSIDRPARARGDGRRIVDLSLPIANGMRGVEITPATTLEEDGWNATTLSLYSHCGTHMDAPRHFLGDAGATIDRQSLDVCCGPAKLVNLVPVEPRESTTVERLLAAVGSVDPGDRLLLRTDWSKRVGTPEYRDALPRIAPELAAWLVARGVKLVGVEPPSVADVNDLAEVTAVHRTLFEGGVVIVEGLVNLDLLCGPIVEFVALPLAVVDGDGSPVRAIAIEAEGP